MNKSESKGTVEYAALIGVDWAAEKHDTCLWDAATGKSHHQVIEHTPEALAEWLSELQTRYPGQRLALCLEQSRGALIYALMGHEFLDLYPINPVTLARYRAAFAPSWANASAHAKPAIPMPATVIDHAGQSDPRCNDSTVPARCGRVTIEPTPRRTARAPRRCTAPG